MKNVTKKVSTHQRILKVCMTLSTKILSSTYAFNIDDNVIIM